MPFHRLLHNEASRHSLRRRISLWDLTKLGQGAHTRQFFHTIGVENCFYIIWKQAIGVQSSEAWGSTANQALGGVGEKGAMFHECEQQTPYISQE